MRFKANKNFVLTIFMVIILLQQNLSAIASSKPIGIHPQTFSRGSLSKPKPPFTGWFTINRYKMVEIEAFLPTTPGHSLGVGHDHPPVAI
ncbi:hypothetical protein CMV_015027 [Castanea mollissima]|uniref:Uncharacterized protein n=1 Tax=Castanea mollissima TaxID=60419 RepID=A0A8J4R5V7_9ROSI|nr:hypothetical protein CMV_015027 [Castanea mollissima]